MAADLEFNQATIFQLKIGSDIVINKVLLIKLIQQLINPLAAFSVKEFHNLSAMVSISRIFPNL